MEACDVLIVGGGPAGSSCAWKLCDAGFDVVVVDRAPFPRDKPCAGWIASSIVDELQLDLGAYGKSRTLQPISGFKVGVIGSHRATMIDYDHVVGYGILRVEFDDYLLQRSGARLRLGTAVAAVHRTSDRWVVTVGDEVIAARMLVGAGGHFCPIARMLDGKPEPARVVTARQTECAFDPSAVAGARVQGDIPELYFARDLTGYGWLVRKGRFLNVGFGWRGGHSLPGATAGFVEFLKASGRLASTAAWRWHGHAYLTGDAIRQRIIDDRLVLVGDAAGLADARSGEGIRPAIESGLMAADAIVAAEGRYASERLASYAERVRARFGTRGAGRILSALVPPTGVARQLLAIPSFARRVVLDRWFLHAGAAPLAIG